MSARHPSFLRSVARYPPFTPWVLGVWAVIAVVGVAAAVLGVAVGHMDLILAAWIAAAAAGPFAFCVDFEIRTGLVRRAPWLPIWVGLVLGGPVAVVVAGTITRSSTPIGANWHTVFVGPVEEAAKLVVPALLLATRRIDARSALLCAIATAASFQAIENLLVAMGVSGEGGGVGSSMAVLLARGAVGPFTHCMWTATVAIGWFGTRAERPGADPRTRRVLGWFAVVAALHSCWDISTGLHGGGYLAPVLAITVLTGTLASHQLATRRAASRWARARRAGVGRRSWGWFDRTRPA